MGLLHVRIDSGSGATRCVPMTSRVKSGSDTGRLGAEAWTDAALEQLATAGIDGVRVEVLAKQLNVTKGSFYWHFKDRDALLQSMLLRWRKRATLALIERIERTELAPHERLRRLLRLPMLGARSTWGADVELAIRLWGRRDERARITLEEVDQLRVRYITQLLIAGGTRDAEAEPRAVLGYAYMRVAATLIPREATAMMERCESLIVTQASTASSAS